MKRLRESVNFGMKRRMAGRRGGGVPTDPWRQISAAHVSDVLHFVLRVFLCYLTWPEHVLLLLTSATLLVCL